MFSNICFFDLKIKFISLHSKQPKYQQLHLRNLCERVQMPDLIKSYVEGHKRSSVSNFNNNGQGGDFIQEKANKTIKLFKLSGMLSPESGI